MSKQRQTSLLLWGKTPNLKRSHHSERETGTSTCESSVVDVIMSSSTEDEDEESATSDPSEVGVGASGATGPNLETSDTLACSGLCCTTDDKAYQLTDTQTLASLMFKGRRFQAQCFKRFAWLSVYV